MATRTLVFHLTSTYVGPKRSRTPGQTTDLSFTAETPVADDITFITNFLRTKLWRIDSVDTV